MPQSSLEHQNAPPHAGMKSEAQAWFESLRDQICSAFEAIEDEMAQAVPGAAPGRFTRTPWSGRPRRGLAAAG